MRLDDFGDDFVVVAVVVVVSEEEASVATPTAVEAIDAFDSFSASTSVNELLVLLLMIEDEVADFGDEVAFVLSNVAIEADDDEAE